MIFTPTALAGCFIVESERRVDERGFFARTYSEAEFEAAGVTRTVAECSISYNAQRGTLRGMHYQAPPHEEAKLIRCTRGSVFDVSVDLRPGSPTFLQWVGLELTAENRLALFVPEGLAHGFLTLEDETEVHYQISSPYNRAASRGFRWNDPTVKIQWPENPAVLSTRDASLPLLDDS